MRGWVVRILCVLSVTAATARSFAGTERSTTSVRLPHPQLFRLPNGLNVVIEPDHTQPRVALGMRYEVGSCEDPKGYAGLSHIVEHLAFVGSRFSRPRGAFAQLERLGAVDLNAETALDATTYHVTVPSNALELALWLESDRMAYVASALTDLDVEREKGIVRNELRTGGFDIGGFWEHLRTAAFGASHCYARRSESLTDLDFIDLNAVRYWYRQHYRPDNASLVLVGDFESSHVTGMIHRYFDSIAKPTEPHRGLSIPPTSRLASSRVEYRQYVHLESAAVVWLIPPPKHPDRRALEVVTPLLVTSLEDEVLQQHRVATGFNTRFEDFQAGSLLAFRFVVAPGRRHEEVFVAVEQTMSQFVDGVLRRPVEDLRENYLARELDQLQEPMHRVNLHLESIATSGTPHNPVNELRAIASISTNDITLAIKRWLAPEGMLKGKLVRDESPNLPRAGQVSFSK